MDALKSSSCYRDNQKVSYLMENTLVKKTYLVEVEVHGTEIHLKLG